MPGTGGILIAKDGCFAATAARLAGELREERRHAVIVLLHPLLERVIVALGAEQTNSEKHLHRRFARLVGGVEYAVVRGGGVLGGRTLGGEEFAHEHVESSVRRNGVADVPIQPPGTSVAE